MFTIILLFLSIIIASGLCSMSEAAILSLPLVRARILYEERQRNAAWGQRMTPEFRKMILEGELTPVGSLSTSFVNPPTPMHLQFAYYESSLVVEFLIRGQQQVAAGMVNPLLVGFVVDFEVGHALGDRMFLIIDINSEVTAAVS